MLLGSFATEFPVVAPEGIGAFVAKVVVWLRGNESSTVLSDNVDCDLDGESPLIRARSGEELRFRRFADEELGEAVGFRHDLPDSDGRIWRTEGVLRRSHTPNGCDLLRFRSQCFARDTGARLETPRKPYLIKSLIQEGWGALDGIWKVDDQPIWLRDDDAGIEAAVSATTGDTNAYLPVVYISALSTGVWSISRDQISKLAFDLGGVAHVCVEPSREFSFVLRERTSGRNVYAGTIGVALPARGVVRRFYLGGALAAPAALANAVRDTACGLRSQMPAEGWDWTELQEQSLRLQRRREKSRLSLAETEKLYEDEIAALQEQLAEARASKAANEIATAPAVDFAGMTGQIGPEIYPGELVDRLRLAVILASARSEEVGLDPRSKFVFDGLAASPPSSALLALVEEIKRCTKDPSRMSGDLSLLLSRHGYDQKSQKNHVKMEPVSGFGGLESITIAKTPSDIRGLKNMRKQVERILGLTKLLD